MEILPLDEDLADPSSFDGFASWWNSGAEEEDDEQSRVRQFDDKAWEPVDTGDTTFLENEPSSMELPPFTESASVQERTMTNRGPQIVAFETFIKSEDECTKSNNTLEEQKNGDDDLGYTQPKFEKPPSMTNKNRPQPTNTCTPGENAWMYVEGEPSFSECAAGPVPSMQQMQQQIQMQPMMQPMMPLYPPGCPGYGYSMPGSPMYVHPQLQQQFLQQQQQHFQSMQLQQHHSMLPLGTDIPRPQSTPAMGSTQLSDDESPSKRRRLGNPDQPHYKTSSIVRANSAESRPVRLSEGPAPSRAASSDALPTNSKNTKRRRTPVSEEVTDGSFLSIIRQAKLSHKPKLQNPEGPQKPSTQSRKWSPEEDNILRNAVEMYNGQNWKSIAAQVPDRDHVQCLQRWKKVLRPGLVKGAWKKHEDEILIKMMNQPGVQGWSQISREIPGRTPKQCRERWSLSLDPTINRSPWTEEEDDKLLEMHKKYGSAWAEIRHWFNGRTENAVKTRYNCLVRAMKRDSTISWTPKVISILVKLSEQLNHDISAIQKHLPRSLKGISAKAIRKHCPKAV
mmetsp:Transcript_12489/g.23179  ORF Transcript_12489/g.23179 Transcript_12489/m.23179 type:complete len:565 (-) Transcript_12489:99-1793(-)